MIAYRPVAADAVVEALAVLLVGGTLTVEDATGRPLSVHAITAGASPVGGSTWLTVAPAVASDTGLAARWSAASADGSAVMSGTGLNLDRSDITQGADVIIDSIRLEA